MKIIKLALFNDILLHAPGERNPFVLTITRRRLFGQTKWKPQMVNSHHYHSNIGPGVKQSD